MQKPVDRLIDQINWVVEVKESRAELVALIRKHSRSRWQLMCAMDQFRPNFYLTHIFSLLFTSHRNSFTFIFVLFSLIVDLIMTLSERWNVIAFLNFWTKMFVNFLNSSTLSQFFIVKLLNKSLLLCNSFIHFSNLVISIFFWTTSNENLLTG